MEEWKNGRMDFVPHSVRLRTRLRPSPSEVGNVSLYRILLDCEPSLPLGFNSLQAVLIPEGLSELSQNFFFMSYEDGFNSLQAGRTF